MDRSQHHLPVLADEVVAFATGERGDATVRDNVARSGDICVVVDATVGAGGHAAAILGALGTSGRLLGLDRDPRALELARERLASFGDQVRLVHTAYDELGAVLAQYGWAEHADGRVDAVIYDLGISSMQIDELERGFSYRGEAALDMRMDPEQEVSAYDVVNFYEEEELSDVLFHYGEEKMARRIAKAIVSARAVKPISTTKELASVIADAVPAALKRDKHPARKTFQAIRIEVNRELERLRTSLPQAGRALTPGGRLVAMSYHSLEDRLIKTFVQDGIRHEPPRLRSLTKKPVVPGEEEQRNNPRSSAAKLRVAERTDVSWDEDPTGGDAA